MRSRAVAALSWLALVACGCADGAPEAAERVEFVVTREGGLCPSPDGGGALCGLAITVRDDGAWSAAGTMPPAPAEGAAPPGAASRLAAVIDEGWDTLTERRFTGTCPTAYDGQEVSFTVRRIPTGPDAPLRDAEIRELRSCVWDVGHADARRILERLEALWRELGLPR